MQRQVKVHEASVVGAQVLITTVALVLPCSVISWAEVGGCASCHAEPVATARCFLGGQYPTSSNNAICVHGLPAPWLAAP